MEATYYDNANAVQEGILKDAASFEASEKIITSFKAKRSTGFFKTEEWIVTLSTDHADFLNPVNNKQMRITKDIAKDHIYFPKEFSLFPSGSVNVKCNNEEFVFALDRRARIELRNWLPRKTAQELKNELRSWGIGLIILAFFQFIFAGFLDPMWGIMIGILGVLNLLIPYRGMFIVNGIVLIIAGILNASAGGGWKFFGMLQFIWGIQEMRKYREYTNNNN